MESLIYSFLTKTKFTDSGDRMNGQNWDLPTQTLKASEQLDENMCTLESIKVLCI